MELTTEQIEEITLRTRRAFQCSREIETELSDISRDLDNLQREVYYIRKRLCPTPTITRKPRTRKATEKEAKNG